MGKEFSFTKMTGAGNDFIVLEGDSFPSAQDSGLDRETIVRLCDRKYGIGADGLMILRDCRQDDTDGGGSSFTVDFYNCDGSTGMLCGNGARCILEYARSTGRIGLARVVRFDFAGSTYAGEVLAPGIVRFFISPGFSMDSIDEVDDLELDGRILPGHFVDVGSLHFVVDSASLGEGPDILDRIDVLALGRRIRNHPRFAPRGVNVNFTTLSGGKLHNRTYERGVEDETLACGMGSTSAALVRWKLGEARPPVTVVTRSGEKLIVDFVPRDGIADNLSLTGPARIVFAGRISLPDHTPVPDHVVRSDHVVMFDRLRDTSKVG